MRLRDLVVVLDNSPRASVQLAMAMELARRHDAHLSGVCPLDLLLPSDIGVLLGGYPDALAMQYVTEQMDAQSREKADAIEARFREQLRVNEVRGDWQAERGIVGDVVASRLRTADLAVIGQPDPNAAQSAMSRYLLEDVLLLAGRPVLAVPYAGSFNAEFRTAMVAWTRLARGGAGAERRAAVAARGVKCDGADGAKRTRGRGGGFAGGGRGGTFGTAWHLGDGGSHGDGWRRV